MPFHAYESRERLWPNIASSLPHDNASHLLRCCDSRLGLVRYHPWLRLVKYLPVKHLGAYRAPVGSAGLGCQDCTSSHALMDADSDEA